MRPTSCPSVLARKLINRAMLNYRHTSVALLFATIGLTVLDSHAAVQNLGVYGNTWSIAEEDAIEGIKNKITKMQRNGEMDKITKEWQKITLSRLENGPDPVPGISRAMRNRARSFDPSVTLAQDVTDDLGNVVAMAGTTINPLKYLGLKREYVLLDGSDRSQVKWAIQRAKTNSTPQILILTAGSPTKLMREHQDIRFYFDQDGRITKRFSINAVPSVVRQKGNLVEIQEFATL